MKGGFDSINKQFEAIDEQLRDIYGKLSQEKEPIKEYIKGNSLWEKVLTGVLLIKNIELVNNQMKELLDLTHSLGAIEEDKTEGTTNPMPDKIYNPSQEKLQTLEVEENKDISKYETSELALDIIKLRDQIFIANDSCTDKQQKMLTSLYEELGRILKINGIESLEESGVFNSQYHTVIDTKATNQIQLNNTIAETYRPGYKIKNKIIRAQEVVIYKFKSSDNL